MSSNDHGRHLWLPDIFNAHTNSKRDLNPRNDLDIHISEATYEHIGIPISTSDLGLHAYRDKTE